jgi:hypothetical protein
MAQKKKPPKKAAKRKAAPRSKTEAEAKKLKGRGAEAKAVLQKQAGKAGKRKSPAPKSKGPKGEPIPLTLPEKSLRDSLILQRRAQGWAWAEIAAEAGLTVGGAQRAFRAKRAILPQLLSQDPMEVVEQMIEGFQASIGDHEKMAAAFASINPGAAVSAKRGADEARRNLLFLLQSIGFLPHELGTIRWLVESRQVVEVIVAQLVSFESTLKDLDMPDDSRKVIEEGAGTLRAALLSAANLD